MKEAYLYWKRVIEQMEADIESAEASIMINEKFLWIARKELSKLKKPEIKKDEIKRA